MPTSAGGDREEHRFGEQLPNQPRPAGAERQPHRDFAAAADRSREQKVRDVRAGDQQHEADDDGEHAEDRRQHRGRAPRAPARAAPHAPASRRTTACVPAPICASKRRGFGLRLLRARRPASAAQWCSSSRCRAPRGGCRPIICGCIAIGTQADVAMPRNDPRNSGGRDADHGHRHVVDRDLPADDRRVAGEAALPVGVADDGDWMSARRAIVVRR